MAESLGLQQNTQDLENFNLLAANGGSLEVIGTAEVAITVGDTPYGGDKYPTKPQPAHIRSDPLMRHHHPVGSARLQQVRTERRGFFHTENHQCHQCPPPGE